MNPGYIHAVQQAAQPLPILQAAGYLIKVLRNAGGTDKKIEEFYLIKCFDSSHGVTLLESPIPLLIGITPVVALRYPLLVVASLKGTRTKTQSGSIESYDTSK